MEGLTVMEAFLPNLDSVPSDLKMRLTDMLENAKSNMVEHNSQTLISVPKKIISAPNFPSFQKNAVPISTPILQSISQEATGLKGLSVEDDQAIDAMLGNLNMEDSPDLDDLKKLTQEIEKEFDPSVQDQNQQSNADRSAKLARPASRPVPHQSAESRKEINQFFKEHNKLARSLESSGQSENTVGTKSSNIANQLAEAGPVKGTIPSDIDNQELDALLDDLEFLLPKQDSEKPATTVKSKAIEEFDNLFDELEQLLDKNKPASS